MIFFLHATLFVTAFLMMLNEFLRGAKRVQIDAFLGVIWVALLIVVFVVFGWKSGLLAVLLSFMYGAVSRPVAARVAAKGFALDGGLSGRYIGLPPYRLAAISRELGRQVTPVQTVEELFSGGDRRQTAIEAFLDYCEASPTVHQLLEDHGLSREQLGELYWNLLYGGAGQWRGGHWVPASALAYPHTLSYILEQPLDTRDGVLKIVKTLFMHFERGTTLPQGS